MSASITASDPYSFDNGSGSSAVSIAKGGSVSFSYPSGMSSHNVVFDTAQPTSCTDMPATASPSPWSGSCTFDAYGTYAFHCELHGSLMRGTVEVPDPNAPTTGTNPPPTDTGGQPPGGGGPTGGELSPPAVKVAHRQRGVDRARERDHTGGAVGDRGDRARAEERARLARAAPEGRGAEEALHRHR